MVEVEFPARWRGYTNGANSFSSSAETVADLLAELVSAFPDLQSQLPSAAAASALNARMVVNDTLVMDSRAAGETALRAGDRISFVLPVAGG